MLESLTVLHQSVVDIYCPRCAWHPQASSRWICDRAAGGCGHIWNTFDTRGVCPKCRWHWLITACHSCLRFSPHQSWYHDPAPPQAKKRRADQEETSDA